MDLYIYMWPDSLTSADWLGKKRFQSIYQISWLRTRKILCDFPKAAAAATASNAWQIIEVFETGQQYPANAKKYCKI